MNNSKMFYNNNNLSTFKPVNQLGWNFYEWEYNFNLTINLSLSFFHRVVALNTIHLYFEKPRIGYLYIVQVERKKISDEPLKWARIYLHNNSNIKIRTTYMNRTYYINNDPEEDPTIKDPCNPDIPLDPQPESKICNFIFVCDYENKESDGEEYFYLDILLTTKDIIEYMIC